jgi:hypothetical protein
VHFTWLAGSPNRSYALKQLGQVFSMDRGLPPTAAGFSNPAPSLVEKETEV